MSPYHIFQSTLPLRGATSRPPKPGMSAGYFNPRSPYGERRPSGAHTDRVSGISIHAPLTGSDDSAGAQSTEPVDFNPRSPYGERQDESCAY